MWEQAYTLQENENELFSLDTSYLELDKGGRDGSSFVSSIADKLSGLLEYIPIIGCCFREHCAAKIVVTNQRVIVIEKSSRCCCGKTEYSLTSFSNTLLDGFNSFSYDKNCCNSSHFRFSIGICRGSESGEMIFDTDTVASAEEASAVLAKFDEIVKTYSK